MKYPYENLGPDLFQEFVQSLLLDISPNIVCYPVGQADGGRDATLSNDQGAQTIVYQVKYSRDPAKVKDPVKWLESAVKEELSNIRALYSRGAKRYYLITNVPGTAKKESGTMDKVDAIFNKYGLVNAQCWWRDDLDRRLEGCPDLRWSYPTLITGMDVLKLLIENGLSENQTRRSLALKAFLRTEFERDEKVRFKQVDLQNDLLKLFIDVPIAPLEAEDESNLDWRRALISSVAARSRKENKENEAPVLRRGRVFENRETVGTAQFLLDKTVHLKEPIIVIEGGPGQGKSTLTQYVSQVHRARLLEEKAFLSSINLEHLEQPVKLPFRIDLRDLSTWLEKKNPFYKSISPIEAGNWAPSVEAFLASQIAAYSGGASFSVDDFYAVVNISHILMIFDGLDEVPDIEQRHKVVESIIDSITRVKQTALSLQAVVTTRPAAFSNAPGFPKSKYPTYKLGFVNRVLAMDYAQKWATSKSLDKQDSEDLFKILEDKLSLPHLEDLSKNPMQLTILLSLIHSRGVSLPDKRTSLYDRYVDLFFNRESEKSSIIREHRDLVIGIHQYIAWNLHAESEKGSQGRVDQDNLILILKGYLSEEGHDPNLADNIFAGIVERVVFLVSRIEGTFEFEVQPLREYFAGRFLYDTAPYSPVGEELSGTLPDRFDGMCRNFYWLNCVRFFSGCYSKGELHSLIDRLEGLVNDEEFKYLAHPRDLAVLLLSDWVFSQYPKSVSKIVSLLFEQGGIRFLGAGVSRRSPLLRSSLKLPSQCGREQLIELCFQELKLVPIADYSKVLTDIIRVNCSEGEVYDFSKLLIDNDQYDQDFVLRCIGDLGALSQYSDLDLDQLEEHFSFSPEFYEAVSRSGKNDYIFKDSSRFERALEMYLEGDMWFNVVPSAERPIDTLLLILDPAFFDFILNKPSGFFVSNDQPLNQFLEEFMGFSFNLKNEECFPSKSHRVNNLLDVFNEEFNRPVSSWSIDISPYANLLQAVYENFGYSSRLAQMACVVSGIRSKEIKCTDSSEIFDDSVPLVKRMRYARLRSGSTKWWSSVFDSESSCAEKVFAIISFVFWSTNRVLRAELISFDECLKSVSSEFSARLFKSVLDHSPLYRLGGNKLDISNNIDCFLNNLSSSTVSILSLRINKASKFALCSRIVNGFKFSKASEWSVVMGSLISILGNKDDEYQLTVLQAVSICYLNCGTAPALEFRYHMLSDNSKIPSVPLAKYVIDNYEKFPIVLILHAESTCRLDSSKRIKPVLDVASNENWFSHKVD